MLFSMTGYAAQSVSLDFSEQAKASLFVEIKAVNGRFFEVVCKLPGALSSLEIPIVNLLQDRFIRGRVYITVRFAENNETFENIVPSIKNAQSYVKAAEQIKKECGITGELAVHHLFALPNVFVTERDVLSDEQAQTIITHIGSIADRLMKTREEEGKNLQADFEKRFATCKQRIEKSRVLAEKVIATIKKDVVDKIAVVNDDGDELAKLQLEDLYATLNKADVNEELTRFESHLKSADKLLKSDVIEKGKRLDFILQEMLRETNTIMAKCADFDISSLCVDIKVEVEKAREQVQNVL